MKFTRPADAPRICKIPECAHTIVYRPTATAGRPRTRHRPGDCSSLGCPCSIPLAADGQVIPADRPVATGLVNTAGQEVMRVFNPPAASPAPPFSSNPFGLDVKPQLADLLGTRQAPTVQQPPRSANGLVVPGPNVQAERGTVDPADPPTWSEATMEPPAPGPYVVEPDSMEGMLKQELGELNYDHPMARTLSLQALKLARAADMAPADDIRMVIASTKALQSVLNDIAGRDGGDEDGDDGPFGAVRAEIRDTRPY
jgi:hypothetical protein